MATVLSAHIHPIQGREADLVALSIGNILVVSTSLGGIPITRGGLVGAFSSQVKQLAPLPQIHQLGPPARFITKGRHLVTMASGEMASLVNPANRARVDHTVSGAVTTTQALANHAAKFAMVDTIWRSVRTKIQELAKNAPYARTKSTSLVALAHLQGHARQKCHAQTLRRVSSTWVTL